MANDTAFRAGRFLQGQVTQDFAGCGPGNPPTYPNGDCTFFGCRPSVQNPCITRTEMPGCRAGGFVGAAGPGAAVTGTIDCNPSAVDACPTLRGCQTRPPTALCTQTPERCPTFCGPECQTPQPNCTSINCTQAGPQCPPPTTPPPCPVETNPILDCTFGCTQFGPACPVTPFPQCANVTSDLSCQTVVQPQAVGAAGQAAIARQTMLVWQCGGPTPATRCFICPPMTFDFNCNIQQGAAAPVAARATAATVCTQSGPQCPSVIDACPTRLCTPATVCTQFGQQCQSAVDACPTRLCGGGGQQAVGSGPTGWLGCTQPPNCLGPTGWQGCGQQAGAVPFAAQGLGGLGGLGTVTVPPTQFDLRCPTITIFTIQCLVIGNPTRFDAECLTRGCPPFTPDCPPQTPDCPPSPPCPTPGFNCSSFAVCTIAFPQCGGGGTDVVGSAFCPTPGFNCSSFAVCTIAFPQCGGGGTDVFQAARQRIGITHPTPATHCFVCDPVFAAGGGAQFAARATAATVCTQSGPQCPSVIDACPTRLCTPATVCTQFGQQCQSAVDACPTRLCGGGGVVGAAAAPGTWPTPQTRCFICPPMTLDYNCNIQQAAAAPFAPTPASHCFVCDPAFAAGGGEQFAARATAATVCTQSGPQCPSAVDACPTRICTPATVCTQFGCGGGGQTAATVCTQFSHQCRSAVDACPTRLCGGGGAVGAAAAPGTWPTPQTRCFVCDPVAAGGAAAAAPGSWPTPATRCRVCDPMAAGGAAAAAPGSWPTPQTRCFIC